jgi:hypothetical protein
MGNEEDICLKRGFNRSEVSHKEQRTKEECFQLFRNRAQFQGYLKKGLLLNNPSLSFPTQNLYLKNNEQSINNSSIYLDLN